MSVAILCKKVNMDAHFMSGAETFNQKLGVLCCNFTEFRKKN